MIVSFELSVEKDRYECIHFREREKKCILFNKFKLYIKKSFNSGCHYRKLKP